MGLFSWIAGLGGGYDAAKASKERARAYGNTSWPADEDRHMGDARDILRLESKALDRNHGLFHGVLNRIADYSMPSVALRFETPDEAYNRASEDFLVDWMKVCDVRGQMTFEEMAWTAVRQVNPDGDGAFLLLNDGRLQPIESELIRNPAKIPEGVQIVQGVQANAFGRPEAFWIAPRSDSGLPDESKASAKPAPAVVFYRLFGRFDQVRGVPSVSSIIPDLIDQRELHRAYVRKTKSDATRAFAVHTEDGYMPDNLSGRTAPGTPKFDEGRPPTWEDSGLKAFFLKNTERVDNITPSTPSATIVQYEENLVRHMSAALGIPAEFWTLDLRNLSWSTSNATVKLAGDRFRSIHRWAVDQFIRPILGWRLMMAIRDGDIPPAPFAMRPNGVPVSFYNKFRVAVPGYLWADEQKHIDAAKAKFQLGIGGLEGIASETGETVDELLDRKAATIEKAIVRADGVSKRTGVNVSWDQIVNANTPGVTSLAEIMAREAAKTQEPVQ